MATSTPKNINWGEMKTRYVTSDNLVSLEKLAKEYGVNDSWVLEKSAKEGWVAERKKYQEGVYRKSLEELGRTSVKTRVDIVKSGIFILAQGLNAIRGDESKGIKSMSPSDYKEALSALKTGADLISKFLPKEYVLEGEEDDDTPEGIRKWLVRVAERYNPELLKMFDKQDEDAGSSL